MTLNEYITELGRQSSSAHDAFQKGLSIYLESINQLRSDELPIKELEKLYGLSFDAYKNANHKKGRFPLLLFPAYKTPSTIIILSEYLASHGFIVASLELKGTELALPEISPLAPRLHTLLIDFLIGYPPFQFIDLLSYGVKLIDHILIASNFISTKYYEVEQKRFYFF